MLEIVAHRGMHEDVPENTMAAFERAISLGADAVEMDVRLTSDHVPVVYHYFYLPEGSGLQGCVFDHDWSSLTIAQERSLPTRRNRIPLLREAVDALAGRIGLVIEIKGPEPECIEAISTVLEDYSACWDSMELTSYEPALLLAMRERCPGLARDLLLPRSESWMNLDVVTHQARHRGRLARARAVHLHPTQVAAEVLTTLRSSGLDIHVWDTNCEETLEQLCALGIRRVCTDSVPMALEYRRRAFPACAGKVAAGGRSASDREEHDEQ
jgi:glycerophosphoryl diester phosphodiesterase